MKLAEQLIELVNEMNISTYKKRRDKILRKFQDEDDTLNLVLQDRAYVKEQKLRRELGEKEYSYRDKLVRKYLGLSYAEAQVLKPTELHDVILGSPLALRLYKKGKFKPSQLSDGEKFVYFLLDCIRVRQRPKTCLDLVLQQARSNFQGLFGKKDYYNIDNMF